MISEAELAQMKAQAEDLSLLYPAASEQRKTLRLIREVEELRKNLNVELDLNTHLVGRIEELRAALRGIVELEGAESPAGIKARAALGEKP